MIVPLLLSLLHAQTVVPTRVSGVCNIRDYGAIADGRTLATSAIAAAIADCASHSGGIVQVPAGTYLTGTIRFQSHITLQLEAGAVLLGSPNLADYPKLAHASEDRDTTLLLAENVDDIAITGEGTIDGNSAAFTDDARPAFDDLWFDPARTRNPAAIEEIRRTGKEGPVKMKERPGVLLLALRTDGIRLNGFHVRGAPNWGIKLMCSDHILVSDIDVRNSLLIPNTDALDISNSSDALIENSYLEAGDDALVVGGPCADGWCKERSTQNVTVNNVILRSRSAAIRIGPSYSGDRRFAFSNVIIDDSNRGVMIQARDAETIEDISFSNIVVNSRLTDSLGWWGSGEPISISVAKWAYQSWNPPVPEQVPNPGIGLIRHIRFSHVIAQSTSPVVLYSTEPGQIQDVRMDELSLSMKASALQSSLGGNLEMRPTAPHRDGIVKQDLSGILLHNVADVSLDHVQVTWEKGIPPFYKNAISATNFDGLRITDFRGRANTSGEPAIYLGSGTGLVLRDSVSTEGVLSNKRGPGPSVSSGQRVPQPH